MYIKNQKYLFVLTKCIFITGLNESNESNFNNFSHCDYDSCV